MTLNPKRCILFLSFVGLSLVGCWMKPPYVVLETKDHDPTLFTQGLIVDGDDLIESSGRYGQSKIVRYSAEMGELKQRASLPKTVFAEGIHLLDGSIYLLTWQENMVYRLNASTFIIEQAFPIKTEGWGLTHNGEQFIQSDGSNKLTFRSSEKFEEQKTIFVRDNGQPLHKLNELEFANGLIWANVYTTPTIVAIAPDSGKVVFSLDMSEIVAKHKNNAPGHELNGIAYDPARDAFWITGKCWNKRYLININIPDSLKR